MMGQIRALGRGSHGGRDGERGQVLPLVVGGMLVFLLFAGLVIDTGVAFRERRVAQNISDLGAMAGTRLIAEYHMNPASGVEGSDVYAAIEASVSANGCTAPCTWSARYVRPDGPGNTLDLGAVTPSAILPANAQGVEVTTDRRPGTFFVRVIGVNEWEVGAGATAMTSQLGDPPPGILLPIAPFDADYETGQNYTLTAGMNGPGNFGWVSWDGTQSAVTLANSICNPDNPAFTFPAWFSGDTGVVNNTDVRDCMQGYIDNQTVVYVPLWRQTNNRPGSNLQYEITGVAAFVLTGYDQHAVRVSGNFQEFYAYPSVPAGFGGIPCSATANPNCNERLNFIGLVD